MLRDIDEYIQKLENEKFASDGNGQSGLQKLISDYDLCAIDRSESGYDAECEVGVRIMTNDLDNGVFGNAGKNKRYYNNSVKRSISRKISELNTLDIDINMNSIGGRNNPISLMEYKINTIVDQFNVLDELEMIETLYYYMGQGIGKYYWNKSDSIDNWAMGYPMLTMVDPRNFFMNPGVKKANKSDKTTCFEIIPFTTERLKKLYPQFKDKITEVISQKLDEIKRTETNSAAAGEYPTDISSQSIKLRRYLMEGITDVVCCQYQTSYVFTVRNVTNNDTGEVITYLEEDYKEYLQQRNDEMTNKFSDLQSLDKLGQDNESNNIVTPEKIAVTKPRKVEFRRWFQVYSIPELGLILPQSDGYGNEDEEKNIDVKNIGKKSHYLIMSGNWNIDRSYSQSMAWDNAKILEIRSIILTMQILIATRFHKPVLVIEQGALLNEEEFMENYSDPEIKPVVDPKWRHNPKNAGLKPFYFVYPQEMGRLAELLERKMETWIEQDTRSTKVRQGIPSYAGESGKAVELRQIASMQGDKTDSSKVVKIIKEFCDLVKDDIIKYMDYPHKQKGQDQNGADILVDVNTIDSPDLEKENNMLKLSAGADIKVKMDDNYEEITEREKQEALVLFDKKLMSTVDAIRTVRRDDAEKIINNLEAENQSLQFAKMINEDENLRNIVLSYVKQRDNSEEQQAVNE